MNENYYEELLKILSNEKDAKGSKKKVKELQKQSEKYQKKNDKLYRIKDDKLLKVLKEKEIEPILYMSHDHPTAGHFGMDATYNKIVQHYYWKGMRKDIEDYVKGCDHCQRRGNKGGE